MLASLNALLDEVRNAQERKDYAGARARIAEAIDKALAEIGEREDAPAVDLFANMGILAQGTGDLQGSEKAWKHVLGICTRTLPDDDFRLQLARLNLAGVMGDLGEVREAETLQKKAVEVLSAKLPADHPRLLRAREDLAITLEMVGDFAGARALLQEILETRSRTLPDDDPDLQSVRLNLANVIDSLGDPQAARALYEKVLEIRSRTLPDDHLDLQRVRLDLGGTLARFGDLQRALALEEKALEVFTRSFPDDHPDLQAARQLVACSHFNIGDLEGARGLFEKVLEVRSRALPDDHPDLQTSRQNLASTIAFLGDLRGARALQEKVLEVRARTLPDNHHDLQLARQNLAATLVELGDLEGARTLGEKILEVASLEHEDQPELQMARLGLARALVRLGDLKGARALQEKVLEVSSRMLPDDDSRLQTARGELAWTIARERGISVTASGENGSTEARERCVELLAAVCRAQTHAARSALLASSTREATGLCEKLSESLSTSLSFVDGIHALEPLEELRDPCFVLSETTRSGAIGAAFTMRLAAASPRYAELRKDLSAQSETLAALVQKGATSDTFREALARRETAERNLVDLGRELSGGKPSMHDLSVDELVRTLDDRMAVVAFRRFKRWTLERSAPVGTESGGTSNASVVPIDASVESLCAFVVRPKREPERTRGHSAVLSFVDLGPIDSIEQSVRTWRTTIGVAPDTRGIGRAGPSKSAASSDEAGLDLRRRLFDPLQEELQGADHVVVALDDVLHLVPLDALPVEDSGHPGGSLLGDRMRIDTRVTLTELLSPSRTTEHADDLLVVGGVSYEEAGRSDERAGILRGGGFSGGFPDLPGTRIEAESIASILGGPFERASTTLLEGQAATREKLLELAPRARWLHIATHGWFAPESIRSWEDPAPLDKLSGLGRRQSGEEQVKGMSPMLLCGLAFAGANLPENAVGSVPGLITAEELSALDLSHGELAVLSACDTNVGERRAGQGVASLQMALQMAGVRSVITSLWKVPDEATRELMTDFYRRLWIEKKPKWQALWEAKRRIREMKEEHGSPKYTTRDWAAWVLTGEPD